MNSKNDQIRTMPLDRLIFNGLDIVDYEKLLKMLENNISWPDACETLGDEALSYACMSLSEGKTLTARQFFLNATAVYRVGQYTIIPDNEQKTRMYRKLIDCYTEAAKLFKPEIRKIEVPFKNYKMSGWLRLPEGHNASTPVVVSLGGADGWREEHHNYSEYYSQRGLAYLMIDGPGQGETRIFNKAYMPVDVENAFNAVINYMYNYEGLGKNIGLIGYSFGGYLAARTASVAKNLKACCVIGGSYEPKEILNFLPHFINVFIALTGKKEVEVRNMLEQINMSGMAGNISCPLYVVHGKPDPLFSVKGVERIYNEASSKDKKIKVWEDGNHCVTNHATEVTTSVVDWFAEKLK